MGLGCRKACSSQSKWATAAMRPNLVLDTVLLIVEPKFALRATIATKKKKSSKCSLSVQTVQHAQ